MALRDARGGSGSGATWGSPPAAARCSCNATVPLLRHGIDSMPSKAGPAALMPAPAGPCRQLRCCCPAGLPRVAASAPPLLA